MILRWIAQVGLFVISLCGYLILDNWVRDDNPYHYLLSEQFYHLQILAGFAVLCLTPFGVWAVFQLWRSVVSLSFFASYSVVRRDRAPYAIVLLGVIAAAYGVASFGQGIYAYGFSVARQIKYNEEISRQIAVERVNDIDAAEGPLASAEALRALVARYPDQDRNGVIERRIAKIEAANALAATLNSEAAAMSDMGLHKRALELYRLATEAFPTDRRAAEAVKEYERKFEEQREQLAGLYRLCGDRSPDALASAIGSLTLLFWDPEAVVAELSDADPERRERAIGMACHRASGAWSSEDLVATVQADLFGERR